MINGNGFKRPTYDDLIENLQIKWRELFGETAQVNSHSVGGILIRILAFFLNQLYMLAEVVYNSQFVDSATGTTLDQLAANAGISRKAAQTGIGQVTIYGVAGFVVPEGTVLTTSDDLMYITTEPIILTDSGQKSIEISGVGALTHGTDNIGIGKSRLLYANESGAKYNKAGTYVAEQLTPVENILYCTINDVTGGADKEDDESLRGRITLSNQMAPSSPYNGVLAGISKVSGVKTVRIITNDTMSDDTQSNTPAKSIHIYVDGGYKDDVAKAIFDTVAAGIATAGKQEVQVTDEAGVSHNVKFDYPNHKPVYVDIKLAKNDSYPLDGDEQIKNIVKSFIDGVGMGHTVHYTYLYKQIYDQVVGIDVADIKIGLSKDSLSAQDLPMNDFEAAELADNGVTIE